MDIYPHVPYFYIVQHIPSQKLYAGSRWAKAPTKFSKNGCNPIEFMVDGGYCTSSTAIKKLIQVDCLSSFCTKFILTEDQCFMDVHSYETIFLQTFDIKNDDNYLNRHNNHSNREEIVFDKYGVTNIMYLQEFVDKSKINNKATINRKYGVDYIVQAPEIMLAKYGVKNIMHLQEFVEKRVINNRIAVHQKYGVDAVLQLPEIKAKQQKASEITVLKKYGVVNIFQLKETKEKSKRTLLEKTGFDHVNKTPENRLRITNQNNSLVVCEFCLLEMKKSAYFSSHGNFCPSNPIRKIKQIPFNIYNIDTLEVKKVLNKGEYNPDLWITRTGRVYFIYNKENELQSRNTNLRKYCEQNNFSYLLFVDTYKKNNAIAKKKNPNSGDVSKYEGWYCRAASVKELLPV